MLPINTLKHVVLLALITLTACNFTSGKSNKSNKRSSKTIIETPIFNGDSAYSFVQKQVDFGPRVPNTEAHAKCANYLSGKLREFGAEVIVQEAEVVAFDNTLLHAKNIIGQYKPELKDRILLFAHWDTRPFADHSEDESRRNEPIPGANDGGSGVGALLEIARQINNNKLDFGIDIIFFDAEDYGTPDHIVTQNYQPDTWCLGSQYWGKNPHVKNYYARYGILLDMVGAKNASFHQELNSKYFAPRILKKVWKTAHRIGYGNYFPFKDGGAITDDHVYVNKYLNIPCINIIHYDPNTDTSFGSFWHTHNDNMDIIDRNTLKAVGQTVLEFIYSGQ
ncbi:Peptidase family M28 [Saccharicrinis carchari]|uniref:Peptidase family M28 n=1 Tax=Saccharicrinis carchari TaxID=1168039 RepID=A0A521DCI9_SACCC|nr:M28 family peptidase [Saccharicrinis carchari]SMO69325.1 Peptidase family M28 [Saccharicrinis carchari]